MSITIRRSYTSDSESDFEFLWATFSSCIEWLVSKGHEAQWGAEPWGADVKERVRNKIPLEDAKGARRWIAEVDGESAGYLDITPFRSDYLPVAAEDKAGKEMFLKTLVVHRKFVGRGVGEFLLQFVKKLAVEEKADWLRLDCWRGPPGKDGLVKYYLRNGFSRAREFVVPPGTQNNAKEWPGQLLEIKVSDLQ
ncbi:acyl-CoA N-acyltransferase [Mycena alexandri]|uniref:Acyl-CoA N-acyltransferase n=1 Tax=Mycena alexandri TaxID=1745969 RepID=A0AAD6SI75_9AGAR|nr:acyl-CoA N-acyltransferase [Mycena alexandri]